MSKYISVSKLKNNKIALSVSKVEGSTGQYKIIFKQPDGHSKFFKNLAGETKICAVSFASNLESKEGSVVNIYLGDNIMPNIKAKYIAVLENSAWVQENIENIVIQLINQAKQMEKEVKLNSQLNLVEQSFKADDYASMIRRLIILNANNLSEQDLLSISSTVRKVVKAKRAAIANEDKTLKS